MEIQKTGRSDEYIFSQMHLYQKYGVCSGNNYHLKTILLALFGDKNAK
ncbi:hypothetical protein [Chryseobacterium sp. JAH]|nr:hypothetical protein [Chryseobacterium sp. JAH]